jgi:integrase
MVNRLTATAVRNAKTPGYLSDGGGLYLQVSESRAGDGSPAKSWIFRYQLNKRQREMGLGSLQAFSLAEARERAARCRQLLADKKDPIAVRDTERAGAELDAARSLTFDACAAKYVEAHREGWKNPKHAEQWVNTLATYVSPVFGALPVQDVDTALVMRALGDIWKTKTETASRLRGRVEKVLAWATVRGYREGDNPARWRGHLDQLLAKRSKVAKVKPRAALPYVDMATFVADLKGMEGGAAVALEFTILTAARTGEAIGATFDEFDLESKTWTVPGERMKSGRPHEVPLSPRALQIVKAQQKLGMGKYVFPGLRPGTAMSNMAMLALLKRMERTDITVHGFRSTFRDWAADLTDFPGEVAEMALAHVVSDKTEAAYRRGTMKDKRRKLMDAWARYCEAGRQ